MYGGSSARLAKTDKLIGCGRTTSFAQVDAKHLRKPCGHMYVTLESGFRMVGRSQDMLGPP